MAESGHGAWAYRGADDGGQEEADARVRAVAFHLFAELGYDGVSSQMIADAADVDPDTLTDRHGGKHDLYVMVFEWITGQLLGQMKLTGRDFTPDADGLSRVVDLYITFCLDYPELPKLWIHRWLSDASDITDIEARVGAPVQQVVSEFCRQAVDPGLDPELVMWTLAWSVNGYMQTGYPDASGQRRPPGDPQALRDFRVYVHQLIRRLATPN